MLFASNPAGRNRTIPTQPSFPLLPGIVRGSYGSRARCRRRESWRLSRDCHRRSVSGGIGVSDDGSGSSGRAVCRKARRHGRAARERWPGCLRRRRGCGPARGAGRADRAVFGAGPGSGDVAVATFAVGLELGLAGQIHREFGACRMPPIRRMSDDQSPVDQGQGQR